MLTLSILSSLLFLLLLGCIGLVPGGGGRGLHGHGGGGQELHGHCGEGQGLHVALRAVGVWSPCCKLTGQGLQLCGSGGQGLHGRSS